MFGFFAWSTWNDAFPVTSERSSGESVLAGETLSGVNLSEDQMCWCCFYWKRVYLVYLL